MLLRFWNSISNIGISFGYDDALKKRTILGNQFTFISALIFISSAFNGFLLGDIDSIYVLSALAVLVLGSFALNKFHKHRFANSLVLSLTSIATFYFVSNLGLHSGAYLFNFPILLSIIFVFDEIKDRNLMIFHFLLILSLFLINVSTDYELFKSDFVTNPIREKMFVTNFVLSFTAISFFVILMVQENRKEALALNMHLEEKLQTEKLINNSLREKSVLVSEIHHRVKNNLAIISSLFNLRITDDLHEDAKKVLVESSNRVHSMALIHNQLYSSDSFDDINFEDYTGTLVEQINISYPMMDRIVKIETNIDNVFLNINYAIPCGLILNELLTNCYKYAFENRLDGLIHISFEQHDALCTLVVHDNGIGLPINYNDKESLGMTVIEAFTEQLDGVSGYTINNGTRFELNFSIK